MIRRLRLVIVAAVVVVGALAAGSYAVVAHQGRQEPPQTKVFTADMNGYQETPSVASAASGEFRATLVEPEKLHFVFTYEGLEGGNSLFAHVHFGERSVAGGVSFFLCGGSTKPVPCPNENGTVEGDITPADVIGPNGQGIEPGSFEEILRALRAGTAYANIHTTRWPGGEIRGQINDPDQKQFEG
jgi:CHRD domain